jgi:hypothetical protein
VKVFKFSAVSMFAEDIRDEVGGTQTIVGILPDNLAVPSFPGIIPKLAVYSRISFDPEFSPRNVSVSISFDNGAEIASDTFSADLVKQSITETKGKDGPIATLISKTIIGGIAINAPSRIRAVVSHDGGEFLAGTINIELADELAVAP